MLDCSLQWCQPNGTDALEGHTSCTCRYLKALLSNLSIANRFLLQIGDNFVAAKAIYDDAPGVYLLLAALAIGSSAYTYWKFEYGGYKGVYSPVDLLEALNREENVFVVDIRPDEDLKEKGVLDLKRRARGKATHLPLVDVRPNH